MRQADFTPQQRRRLALTKLLAVAAVLGAIGYDGHRKDRQLEAQEWVDGPRDPLAERMPSGWELPLPDRTFGSRGGSGFTGSAMSFGFSLRRSDTSAWLDAVESYLTRRGCEVERSNWILWRKITGRSPDFEWTVIVRTNPLRRFANAVASWKKR